MASHCDFGDCDFIDLHMVNGEERYTMLQHLKQWLLIPSINYYFDEYKTDDK